MKEQLRRYNTGISARQSQFVSGACACSYLTRDGNRCAIGCFIPTDHEGLHFNGSVYSLFAAYVDLAAHMPLALWGLGKFQAVHDGYDRLRGASSDPVNYPSLHAVLDRWIDENVVDTNEAP